MNSKPKTVELDSAATDTAVAAQPTTFTIERLRKECLSLFGVTFSTYDGATHGLTGDFSVEEMRNRIERWQGTGMFSPKTIKKEAN